MWTSYDEDGRMTRQGRKFGGNFVGPWRSCPLRLINAQGWYAGKTSKSQTGTWEHYHANGIKERTRCARGSELAYGKSLMLRVNSLAGGSYDKGQKSGIWQERPNAEAEFQAMNYIKGKPDGEVQYGDEWDKL